MDNTEQQIKVAIKTANKFNLIYIRNYEGNIETHTPILSEKDYITRAIIGFFLRCQVRASQWTPEELNDHIETLCYILKGIFPYIETFSYSEFIFDHIHEVIV